MSRFISVRTTGGKPITINVSHIVFAREDGSSTVIVLNTGSANPFMGGINIAMRYPEFINMVKAEDYE